MGEEMDIAMNNLNTAYAQLQAFYDYYSKPTIQYDKGIKV
jgi:hypothetical protein